MSRRAIIIVDRPVELHLNDQVETLSVKEAKHHVEWHERSRAVGMSFVDARTPLIADVVAPDSRLRDEGFTHHES
jgi:hypothetical protein